MMAIENQARRDDDHLTLVSVSYYVAAALLLVWTVFPLLHLGFGTWLALHPETFGVEVARQTRILGGIFMAFASAWLVFALVMAATLFLVGRSLARRRRYVFCLVAAGVLAALCVPLGTILGILTIVVLLRPSVKEAFGRGVGPRGLAVSP
jgi:hypothetical protein